MIWNVRTFIYAHFVATTEAPTTATIAEHFGLAEHDVLAVLHALHAQHALFLDGDAIRIANPFSAVPTDFVTEIGGKRYWANCAWDSLGIVVAIGAPAARIDTNCGADGQPLLIEVVDGKVIDTGALAHVLVPFRHWYDDMAFT